MTIERSVFLIGMMASGKSTVGKKLAKRLDWAFFDVDREIETNSGVSVGEIFEVEGEAGFRKRESRMMQALTKQPHVVVAMGGGAPLFAQNREYLKRGFVVQLRVTAKDVLERTHYDKTRPLLRAEDRQERVETLLRTRQALYDEVSDLIVDTTGKTPVCVVDEILTKMERV